MYYPKGQNIEKSTGIIKSINENNYLIKHKYYSEKGSSCGPLLNISNSKVMGVQLLKIKIKNGMLEHL